MRSVEIVQLTEAERFNPKVYAEGTGTLLSSPEVTLPEAEVDIEAE